MEGLRRLKPSFDAFGCHFSRRIPPNAADSLIGERFRKCKLHRVPNAADSLIGGRFIKCKPHLPLIYQNLTKSRGFSSYSHVRLNFSPKPKPKRYFSLFLKLIAAALLVPLVYVLLLYLNEVPYTLRKRLPISYPDHRESILGDKMLEIQKSSGEILPAAHPHSVKVRSILEKLVDALHRDLGLDGPPIVAGRIISESNRSEVSDKGLTESRRKIRGWRTDTSHLEGVNWQVLVVDKPENEAYVLAGGSIVVSSGLLVHHSDVEIAAVLAHEVGHIVARHLAEFITVICRVVYHNLSKYMDLRPLFVDMQRRAEKEADYIALQLMASAGYDPRMYENLEINYSEFEENGPLSLIWRTRHVTELQAWDRSKTKGSK